MNSITPSVRDFSLIKTYVDAITADLEFKKTSYGFMFFVLDVTLGLQEDEIIDSITDNSYLSSISTEGKKGHDRGIDAVYIDESSTPPVVHFYNCKYTEQFKKTSSHFPGEEIDKISGFIADFMKEDENLSSTINPILYSKVEEIWGLFRRSTPNFIFHICSNSYLPFEDSEKRRFELALKKYSIKPQYDLLQDFVAILSKKGRQTVNARIRAIDQNFFEKSDGDIRALIVDVDAKDLIRIVMDDENLRWDVEPEDYSIIQKRAILEDAFEDNVRIYLKQRSKINREIKATAQSDENHRFFYYNNGITITCTKFDYPKNRRNPIVELSNLQIVNGSQTVHALYDAFVETPDVFRNIDILCRIYETSNEQLSINIAEATNSQNPVTSRDIRANDSLQKKLDKELERLGYFYERKKSRYAGKPWRKRIDAEKAGQALMAFYNKMPGEAKDKKKIIFGELYNTVFSDEITADSIILAFNLYQEIEQRKLKEKTRILESARKYNEGSFILHSTYYIMYAISELADIGSIPKNTQNYNKLIELYDESIRLIKDAIRAEKKNLKGYKEKYNHREFFKGTRPKEYLENAMMHK